MKCIIKTYTSLPCCTETFTINGITAEIKDFGIYKDDRKNINTKDKDSDIIKWGCINRVFTPISYTKKILYKYDITKEEYNNVVEELKNKLLIGECNWCV